MRLHAAPRALAADGKAARAVWQIADGGIGNATAYLAPDLGGWHWVAVLGPQDLGHGGAVLLTIGPDGARWVERYGDEGEAWRDMEYIAGRAEDDRAATTPAQFAAILDPVAVREPLQRVAAVVAPVAVILEPEPVAVAAMVAEPVAPVVALEPVAAPAGQWQRVRGWLADQVAAMVNPWLGHGFDFELPQIVSLADSEPEPMAEPSQPGRPCGWVLDQVSALVGPWLGRGFGWDGPRPNATAAR